jgi:hypothetical protein
MITSSKQPVKKVASGATKDSTRSLRRQLFGDGIQAQLYLTIQLLLFQPGPYSKNEHKDNGSYCTVYSDRDPGVFTYIVTHPSPGGVPV